MYVYGAGTVEGCYAQRFEARQNPVMHWKLFVQGFPMVTMPIIHILVLQLLERHSLFAVHISPIASRGSVQTIDRHRMEAHSVSKVHADPRGRAVAAVVVAAVVVVATVVAAVVVVSAVVVAAVVVAESTQRMLVHIMDWQSVAATHIPPIDIRLAAQVPRTQKVEAHSESLAHATPFGLSVGAGVVGAAHWPLTQLFDMH